MPIVPIVRYIVLVVALKEYGAHCGLFGGLFVDLCVTLFVALGRRVLNAVWDPLGRQALVFVWRPNAATVNTHWPHFHLFMLNRHPRLKIILEHITTKEAVDFVNKTVRAPCTAPHAPHPLRRTPCTVPPAPYPMRRTPCAVLGLNGVADSARLSEVLRTVSNAGTTCDHLYLPNKT